MGGARRPLSTTAPAKVNWTLEVLARRPDGYHELRSVMQTLSLADTLTIEDSSALTLTIDGPAADEVPIDGNLVLEAVRLFPERLARCPVQLRLQKRIPAAAGLGGGSSDAAAALRLLRAWWDVDGDAALAGYAARLGSDVAFFMRGGLQLASGRGELLTSLPDVAPVHLVLLTPPITVAGKTAALYRRLTPAHFTDGARSARLAEKVSTGGPPAPEDYFNVFDAVADEVFPTLRRYRLALEQAAGGPSLLAGAGPSMFAVCRDAGHARAAALALADEQGLQAVVVSTRGSRVPEAVADGPYADPLLYSDHQPSVQS